MSNAVTVYGISNCDAIKKAKSWLDKEGVAYGFHDYRKQGLDIKLLNQLVAAFGWESLLNRRGTTWRKLPEELKNNIDRKSAIKVMLENPAIIKRPLLDKDKTFHLGFNDAQYRALFDA